MAAVGLIVTALIAVTGWLVAQTQARRATRRNMRINYLLDAYRRLDRAGNRPLAAATGQELEAAISDIMLLGSPSQAQLAAQFVQRFTAQGAAESQPLLQDLRASLRRELLLEPLPPSTYISLRISADADTAHDRARIWRETAKATQDRLSMELVGQEIRSEFAAFPDQMAELAKTVAPSAAVAASTQRVERALRELLTTVAPEDLADLNIAQLANRALQLKLIDRRLADTINGLNVMRLLAATDQDRLDNNKAAEYAALSAAALYLLDQARRRIRLDLAHQTR